MSIESNWTFIVLRPPEKRQEEKMKVSTLIRIIITLVLVLPIWYIEKNWKRIEKSKFKKIISIAILIICFLLQVYVLNPVISG